MKNFLLIIPFLLLASCVKDGKTTPNNIINYVQVDDPVPEFTATGKDGADFNSSGFSGKRSILVLFNTGCKDCRRELPVIEKAWKVLKEESDLYQVIAISREQTNSETDKYWKDNNLSIPKYADPDRVIFSLFANSTIPRIYIIDTQGIVTWMAVEALNMTAEQLVQKVKSS